MPVDSAFRGRFLPVHIQPDWLAPDLADSLLAYAIDSQARFMPAAVLYDGNARLDPTLRDALKLTDLGPLAETLKAKALAAKQQLVSDFGVPPFEAAGVEIELAAHGHGAHFRRHIDTFVVVNRATSPRVLTLVFYLNRRPRAYAGGEIRLYALGSSETKDIQPEHNLLVAFPSIAPHSVERVDCPNGVFADRRFAINIWIHGRTSK